MAIAVIGIALILITLADAFITIVLPKTVSRSVRPTKYFNAAWAAVSGAIASRLNTTGREAFLGVVWPLSTLVLIAVWAITMMFGFALLQFGLGTPLSGDSDTFATSLYMSAATFLTLGYGDVTATSG